MDEPSRPFFLRVSMGIVFIWFGALKFTGISPANELVAQTVYWFPPEVFIPVLGWWEVIIGSCLLIRPLIRAAIFLLLVQMPGTMLPLVLLPEVCFTKFPFGLTMEGQYIIKNLILISAAYRDRRNGPGASETIIRLQDNPITKHQTKGVEDEQGCV